MVNWNIILGGSIVGANSALNAAHRVVTEHSYK